MQNKKWIDSVLGIKEVPKTVVVNSAVVNQTWEDLKADKISVFEYNKIYRNAIKFNSKNTFAR